MKELGYLLVLLSLLCGFNADPYTPPSTPAISSARELYSKGYNLLDFYKALKWLYLSNGFDMGNPINAAILQEPEISESSWKSIIEGLEASRREIKDGDIRLKTLSDLISSVSEPEGSRVLNSIKAAIREYTNTSESDLKSPIDLLVTAKDPVEFLTSNSGVFDKIQDASVRKSFLESASSALSSGSEKLNAMEIKNALVAAARLVQNVGEPEYFATIERVQGQRAQDQGASLEKFIQNCQNLTLNFKNPNNALKTIKALMAEEFFVKIAPKLPELLKPFRFLELSELQDFLKALMSMDPKSLASELQVLMSSKGDKLKKKIAQLEKSKNKSLKIFAEIFSNSLKSTEPLTKGFTALIQLLRSSSQPQYLQFLSNILELSQQVHDGSDVCQALINLTVIIPNSQFFSDLTITSTGSFPDYLDTVRMLNSPQFAAQEQIRRKYLSGNPRVRESLAQLGVLPAKIATWIYATRSLDPTVALLKASGSREALGTMLGFHGDFTTNQEDPDKSVVMIGHIIKFMEMDGKFEGKRNKRASVRFGRNGSASFSS